MKEDKKLDKFMAFVNIAMLKDMAIELNELYMFSDPISPIIWNESIKEHNERMKTEREDRKRTSNKMVYI